MSHGGSVWEEQPAKRLRAIRRARWKAAYRRVTRILEAIVTALLLAGVVLVGGLLALAGLALTTLLIAATALLSLPLLAAVLMIEGSVTTLE